MALVEDLNSARKRLFESLGDTTKMYCQLMKQWFSMKITKEEFDLQVRKAMNSEQTRLHNEFLLCLFNKCTFLTSDSRGRLSNKKAKLAKQKRTEKGPFQPGDRETPPLHIQENAQRYCVQEYFLPEQSFIMGRLMLGAWELGMDGAEDAAAECLVTAVQYFMKNILTAVMIQRSGFKVTKNRVIHSVGAPIANPWLQSQLSFKPPSDIHVQNDDLEDDDVALRPTPLLSISQREKQEAFEFACATTFSEPPPKGPITAYDLLSALTTYKSTIPSHSIYALNLERIISALDHPSWDDLAAAKFVKS